jgi:ubiquinone/menaquinone biosynthesis C-methylase UbiE
MSFDRVADRYDDTRGGFRRGEGFAASIRPLLAPGTVLEVGVGTGVVSAALVAGGTAVAGVDISPLMARRAYHRLGARLALGDALALPVADGCVDNVLLAMVLHVVGDVRAALAEAARVLRPGGRALTVHSRPKSSASDLDGALAMLNRIRPHRPDEDGPLADAGHAAGLRLVRQDWTDAYPVARSPNKIAKEIEERTWSYLWHLDDVTWHATAAPAIRTLRSLPDPDRPRNLTHRHRISVFQRPATA